MSRGLGKAQRLILLTLEETPEMPLTIAELAARTDRSEHQTRGAVTSLEARELVVVKREQIGWKGVGEYGPETWVPQYLRDADGNRIPTADGEPEFPSGDGYWRRRIEPYRLVTPLQVYRGTPSWRRGVPVYGMRVWLTKADALQAVSQWRRMRNIFGSERTADLYADAVAACQRAGIEPPTEEDGE